ncbi:hypothetical protein Vretifemale_13639, partial [Volvox reticuliferus]
CGRFEVGTQCGRGRQDVMRASDRGRKLSKSDRHSLTCYIHTNLSSNFSATACLLKLCPELRGAAVAVLGPAGSAGSTGSATFAAPAVLAVLATAAAAASPEFSINTLAALSPYDASSGELVAENIESEGGSESNVPPVPAVQF